MNINLKFTEEDMREFMYLLHNAPIDITYKEKRISPMNGLWYTFEGGKLGPAFKNFHDAVKWLLNPFWEEANGHPYE